MNAWVLVGPTATGKSVVAHLLAEEMGAVVLCADAMTVYRAMDIGTAKPNPAMRARVSYFGLDLVNPDELFSAGQFREAAREAARAAEHDRRPLIAVGGSGLYLNALLRGLDEGPPVDPSRRAVWERLYREQGLEALQMALRERSPALFESLADPKNPRRIIRALERAETGSSPPFRWRSSQTIPPVCGLAMEPAVLKGRIRSRVRAMMEAGLLEEAASLRARWPALSHTAKKAIGYEEAFAVLDGALDKSQAEDRISARTWQLARRQMTWFRHQLAVSWIAVTEQMTAAEIASAVRRQWEQDGPSPLYL